MKEKIILASGSENRRLLLQSLDIPFVAIPSSIDEKEFKDSDPINKVQKIARAKAYAVAKSHEGIIISADTFSVYNGKHYEKPADVDAARDMLYELSGQEGQTVTGICIINTKTKKELTTYRVVTMRCKNLTDEEIQAYITSKPVTNWAATYNPLDEVSSEIFRPVGEYVYKIEYYGLPVDVIAEALKDEGYNIDLTKFHSFPKK